MTRTLLCAAMLLVLATCDRPSPPDPERPPQPQATPAAASTRASRLHDAIQAPLDKARAVEAQTLEAADRQRAAIDAASSPTGPQP